MSVRSGSPANLYMCCTKRKKKTPLSLKMVLRKALAYKKMLWHVSSLKLGITPERDVVK